MLFLNSSGLILLEPSSRRTEAPLISLPAFTELSTELCSPAVGVDTFPSN